jgi:hypothetical protein
LTSLDVSKNQLSGYDHDTLVENDDYSIDPLTSIAKVLATTKTLTYLNLSDNR